MPTHVMVVDDAPEIAELYSEILADAGYAVSTFSDPSHALAEVTHVQPDLIITDWLFDGQPAGLLMVVSIKVRPQTTTIPMIVCTAARREIEVHEAYLHANDVQVVLKPFLVSTLLQAVRSSLDGAAQVPSPMPDVYHASAPTA